MEENRCIHYSFLLSLGTKTDIIITAIETTNVHELRCWHVTVEIQGFAEDSATDHCNAITPYLHITAP